MTPRERFIRTLHCERIGGQVPTFELEFRLTMEAFGRVHVGHRNYAQWDQMSRGEKRAQLRDIAQLYVDIAERYDHSAIMVLPTPGGLEGFRETLENIREISGDKYCLVCHGDPTWSIPDGDHMMDFAAQMYEDPDPLNETSKRRT